MEEDGGRIKEALREVKEKRGNRKKVEERNGGTKNVGQKDGCKKGTEKVEEEREGWGNV